MNNKTNQTNISFYNRTNNLNIHKLSLGKTVSDYLELSIYCLFSVVSPNRLNCYLHIGKNMPIVLNTLKSLTLLEGNKHIYIVTSLPELFSDYASPNISVISITSYIDQIDSVLSNIFSDVKINRLFIFHGIKWSDVILLYKFHKIDVYGLKYGKRHFLNRHHLRLVDYLVLLYGSLENVMSSLVEEPKLLKYWSLPRTDNLFNKETGLVTLDTSTMNLWDITGYYLRYYISYIQLMKIRSHLESKENEYSSYTTISLNNVLDEHDKNTNKVLNNLNEKMSSSLSNSDKEKKYANYILNYTSNSQLKREKIIQDHVLRQDVLSSLVNEFNIIEGKRELALTNYEDSKNYLNNSLNSDDVSCLINDVKGIDLTVKSMHKSKDDKDFKVQHTNVKHKGFAISNLGNSFKRSYSTKVEHSVQFPIENTIYSKIYPYIIDANMPHNTSDPQKMEGIQLSLEEFLFNQGAHLLDKNIQAEVGVNPTKITTSISDTFLKEQVLLYQLLDNMRKDYSYILKPHLNSLTILEISNLPAKSKAEKIFIEFLLTIKSNHEIASILWGRLLRIISNNEFDNLNSNSTSLHMDTGIAIYNLFIEMYFKHKNIYNLSYREFKYDSEYSDMFKVYKDPVSLHFIGSWLMYLLVECDLVINKVEYSTKNNNRNIHFFRPNSTITNKLQDLKLNNTYLESSDMLPMLIPPKNYSQEISSKGIKYYTSGGYLLNGIKYDKPLIIENHELLSQSSISEDNYIYNMVNTSMSVGFKINSKVLNFILKYNNEYQFLIEPDTIHPLTDILSQGKEKLSSLDIDELNQFNSDKMVQGHIMRLAIVYKDLPCFYIPSRIDNRGRLYAVSSYLHYQSTELAKSLLSFANYEKIDKSNVTAINYLKVYGANLYGNGVDKLSFNDKLVWFNNHVEDIINYENGKMLHQADNKLLFLAFCIEYETYNLSLQNNLTYFYSDFPVQVDASCNGYQHLSLLLGDDSLAEKLNLKERSLNDKPEDFYSFIGINLKDLFKEKIDYINAKLLKETNDELLEEKASYERLYKLNIHRSLIKKPIMTKPYNVTIDSMREYILEDFTLEQESRSKIYLRKQENRGIIWYSYNKDPSIKLTESDIWLLCVSINFLIYKRFPNLFALTEYFKNVANACNALKISIPWMLPSGLEIDQKYLESKIIKVRPFNHKKDTYNLQLPDTKKINKTKQTRALMPNLIHSLDGASLALVVDVFSQFTNKFYSVHDCFASTCNNIDELINTIRMVFFKIYASESYLIKFDKHVKEHIFKISGWDLDKPIVSGKKKYTYPNIHKIIENSNYNYENLKKSRPVN